MSRSLELDDLYSIPFASDPQLSPDGATVAYVVTTADREADENRSRIWAVPASGDGEPQALTTGDADALPRWSPDGRHLAFVSKRGDGPPQLFVLPTAGGEARKLTELPLGSGEPVWSPDGASLAFAAPVDLDGPGDEKKSAAPVVTSRLDYKADGAGLLRNVRQHLFVTAADGGAPPRQLTAGDFFVTAPVWSPDGTRIAFAASTSEDRDLSPAAAVHVVPAGGGPPRRVTPEEGYLDVVAWSPDGTTLLLAGQERLHVGHVRLYTMDADGGALRELLPGFDRNVMVGGPAYPGAPPRYAEDGATVLFCARERGLVHVLAVPASGGEPETVIGGDRVVAGMTASGGTISFVASTATSPGEIFVREGERERALTAVFAEALPEVELVEPQRRAFRAPDGTEVEGWIIRGDAAGPTPLLLDVHGGPHNAWGPVFDGVHLWHQTLASKGWTILFVNPRGSDGYGERFWTGLLDGGWGRADEQDFIAAIDSVVEEGLADPDRLAVTGYSYGGYMTCWLTARTERFAAGVAGGCVSDLLGEVGTADMGWFLGSMELDTSPYEKQEAIAELSPITYVSSVHTPTLVLHGEEDRRCPISQGEQWFTALRSQGVPTELVRYPGGSHLFILSGPPSHRVDYGRRVEEWVARYAERRESGPPTRRLEERLKGLQSRLASLIERHRVPGAQVAVLADGEVVDAAAGVLNVDTGVEATPDSVFQLGSIGKVWTATVVMQLVDEGLLDLDAPIVEVLPEFRVADPDVSKRVTMRHLLSHSSGIDGDHFVDTGRGDDCLERYVGTCAELQQTHPLGATMSYCNAGYVVAGRVIEKLTGKVWDAAMKERLFDPLGLSRTVTLPEEVLRFRAAFGHMTEPGEPTTLAPAWHLPRSTGPAGVISSTARELLEFARMHLEDGRAVDGTQVLSSASVRAMQEAQVEVPDPYTLGSHWGLGWILFDWDGRRLIGHDGNTIGQSAFMRILPERGLAVALLTNGGSAHDLYEELYGELLAELGGVQVPARPEPLADPPPIDWPRFLGTYERASVRIDVEQRDGGLVATTTVKGPLAALLPKTTEEFVLHSVGPDVFVTRPEGTEGWTPVVFFDLPDGTRCIHFGARATPRVDGSRIGQR